MHEYFHTSGITDLEVIRSDANYRLHRRHVREESLIHLHPAKRDDPTVECYALPHVADPDDTRHEWFLFEEKDG